MTRTAISALALAGLNTSASAQTIGVVTVTSSATTVNIGDTFTIGVVLSDNIPEPSVYAFDLRIFGVGLAIATSDPTPHPIVFGFGGEATPTGATAHGGTSDIFGPPFDPTLDDLTVFTFHAVALEVGILVLNATDGDLSPNYDGMAIPDPTTLPQHPHTPYHYDEVIYKGVTVNVIPAPSAAVILAFAGSLATRRQSRTP